MEVTYVDENNLKSLEDYAVFLTTLMLSLKTFQNIHVKALEVGILPEDLNERANTMIWDIRRLLKMHKEQLENVLELVPDDFNVDVIIDRLKKRELTKARSMTRKRKGEDNASVS